MPSYPLTALVLRKTKLGETDIILTLLAQDGQQVRAVAKGLRKPGSRFGGRLEPLSEVDLLVHTGRSLEVVSEARTVNAHAALREDLDRSAAAAVVADLLDKVSVQGQAEPRLYGLASASLGALEVAPLERVPQLVVAFLAKAMAMHGYRPELESCAACACEVGESSAFSPTAGGSLCACLRIARSRIARVPRASKGMAGGAPRLDDGRDRRDGRAEPRGARLLRARAQLRDVPSPGAPQGAGLLRWADGVAASLSDRPRRAGHAVFIV